MIGNITPTLPEKLVGYLRPGAPALLLTSGADVREPAWGPYGR